MRFALRLIGSFAALAVFSAEAADITGEWTATIVTAAGQREYTYTFRQSGAQIFGTARSQDGVVTLSNGYVNNKTITFDENVTVTGRRAVLEYTGELVSDTEIRFKRQTMGTSYPVVTQFVATRIGNKP